MSDARLTPILEAQALGQSIWFDDLSRALITSGALARMIAEGLRGMTSNPSTFEKAIARTGDYDASITRLVESGITSAPALFEHLAIEDIRAAADLLHPVFVAAGGGDGFVSLEVSPRLAQDTDATVAEARRLFSRVQRENVMIKVPGTVEGIAALPQLIAAGVNVNVTLLFAVDVYRATAEAYMAGLEQRLAAGHSVEGTASVASFFLSRIDTAVDRYLTSEDAAGWRGKAAVANAKIAYAHYREMMASARWQGLAARGARPQRLLWASTSTKDPRYPKLMYVEELMGPETVNTMPAVTYDTFKEQGRVRATLTENVPEARRTLAALTAAGVPFSDVCDGLLVQGIEQFADAYGKMLASIDEKLRAEHGRRSRRRDEPRDVAP